MSARLALSVSLFAAFVATVVAANWALSRYGMVPVGFGLEAPAGVYAAGFAFGLRDALHERAGREVVLVAIAVGAALTLVIEDASAIPGGHAPIFVASALAFAFSELADFAVYERITGWWQRVFVSNTVGAVVDSALFLWLAFGTLGHLTGQVVGKTLMIAPALALMWLLRRRPLAVAT